MNHKDQPLLLIIGAGVAGLAAGIYGQMNGYHTEIFERHTLPGGVCTSWKRKGYTFDGAIHWLTGTRPGTAMHKVLCNLGALGEQGVINHEVFRHIVIGDRYLDVYTQPDRLELEMLRVSPQDKEAIQELITEIKRFAKFEIPLDRTHPTPKELFKMLPFLPGITRYQNMSIGDYAARFKDPFLKEAFLNIFPMPGATMMIALLTLALFSCGDNGYPLGGSLYLARSMEQRYLALGGKIHYNALVERILVENGCALGIRLANGIEHQASYIISAADGHSTLFEMLGEEYVDAQTQKYYQELPLFKPLVYVCLGINRDLSAEPHIVTNVLKPPIEFAGEKHERLGWFHYCYDPSSAPKGKSAVISMIETDYKFWYEAYQALNRYDKEKQKVAQLVIGMLEEQFPGIRSQVEVIDVATPMTWVRYTGNWQGAYEGWLPGAKAMAAHFKKQLSGLKNFYMCGQWVEPGGGVPVAMISGRNAIRMICRQDRLPFRSSPN